MRRFNALSIAVGALLVLSGCVGMVDTDSVAMMGTKGSPFQKALHKEYVELAVLENKEGDDQDAMYFIEKARKAGSGADVGPQPLAERKLPAANEGELSGARQKLVDKLWKGATDVTPSAAARAQAMFDCWMQEQEENFQPKDIARCRAEFDKAYALLGTPAPKAEAPPAPAPKPAPPPPLPGPYVVYFDTDSADVDDKGMVAIKQAFADYRLHKPGKVWIAGHTDTVGNKMYNMGLSRHRANAVGNLMMELGVPRKMVEKARHGEDSPAVSTGDNVSEGNNRRVSIMFMR